MTKTCRSRLVASLSATAFALLLQQPALAEDATPATGAAASPPAEQPAEATVAPAQHPAQTARAAFEERRAAHMAEMDTRYSEFREKAASRGFDLPSTPPWTDGTQWLSFEEMQERMKAQGVAIDTPAQGAAPAPPSMPTSPVGAGGTEERKQIFETIEQMTPEEQRACFAVSRWHAPRMPRPMPPAYSRQRMPQFPPGYGPRYGQPYRGMMRPQ